LDDEKIAIAMRLLAARRAGQIEGLWIDRGVVRIGESTQHGEPAIRRMIDWDAARRLADRLADAGKT
jgi:hypothetical protein